MKVSTILCKIDQNTKSIEQAKFYRSKLCSAVNNSDIIKLQLTLKEADELNDILKDFIFLCDNENKRLGELETTTD